MSGLFTPVPTNMVLTSGVNSALTWTNAMSVSSMNVSSLAANVLSVSTLTTSSSVTASTITTGRLNYSSIVGSSISSQSVSSNTITLSLTNTSTQNTQIYQVATTNPTTSYTVIQASHVSTGTTNNALALNPSGGNVGVGTTAPTEKLQVNGNIYMGSGYRNLSLSGGNSNGYLYGCYDKYADMINMGYNFYNNNTSNVIPNTAAPTSRLSLGLGTIAMYTGGVNTEPTNLGVYQQSDGRVGVGTTAPATMLDVNGIARAISGFGTNSGSIIGLTTSGSIAHTFRGGIALLTAVGSNNVRYMGFVTWIGNVSSPFIDQIVSVSLTASINTGTLAISFATTAGTANIAWNITYLSCPTWSPTTTFTPGF